MIKNDFLMKKIEEIMISLEEILKLRENEKYEDAFQLLSKCCEKLIGVKLSTINSVSNDNLIKLIDFDSKLNVKCFPVLGKVLKEEGDMYIAQGKNIEAFNTYVKSLYVFYQAILRDEPEELNGYFDVFQSVIEYVEAYELPREIKLILLRCYEVIGDFSKGDDLVFELVDGDDCDDELVDTCIKFYTRLLDKTPEELIKGNLPKEEVEDSLEELKGLKNK